MIEDIFNMTADTWIGQIQSNIEAVGANASGQTSASLRKTVTDDGVRASMVIDAARHFFVLETGRGPGGFPPLSRIEQWIIDKPVPGGKAYPIAKVIAEQGTKLFRVGGRDTVFSNVVNDESVNELLRKLEAEELMRVEANIIPK
jgi:hypothetical protein